MNVYKSLDLVNTWFKAIENYNVPIPTNFDFSFFLKGLICNSLLLIIGEGIHIVIEGEHSLCIAKSIWLIYNNYHSFPSNFILTILNWILVEIKREICELLLNDSTFFKLFLHWSWNVRTVFHHFLLFRVYHLHQRNISQVDPK